MSHGTIFWTMTGVMAVFIAPERVAAQDGQVEILISEAGMRGEGDGVLVDLRVLNNGAAPAIVALPERVQARLRHQESEDSVWLSRSGDTPAEISVPPGGFARARYRMSRPVEPGEAGALISIPAWGPRQVAIASRPTEPSLASAPSMPAPSPSTGQAQDIAPPSDRSAGNAFLANLSVYEPIYAVYGPGTNSEARIQISFKYRLFGTRRDKGLPGSWRDGLHFAFTQRMFWDLGARSSPFRNVDYQPQLFYLTPSAVLANGIALGAQGGIRHESNGRDGDASRSINSIYVAPMAAIPLAGGYRLTVAPRLSLYVGDRSDNPDIRRYRGNTALFMEVGEDDGLRLSASTRLNLESGKGAVSADLSYPLTRMLGGAPDFYLFGQSFVGYGENLLDYDRRTTRFRIGLALVR